MAVLGSKGIRVSSRKVVAGMQQQQRLDTGIALRRRHRPKLRSDSTLHFFFSVPFKGRATGGAAGEGVSTVVVQSVPCKKNKNRTALINLHY